MGKLPSCGLMLLLLFLGTSAIAQNTVTSLDESVVGQIFDKIEPVTEAGLHGFFQLLDNQPIAFVFLALAAGTFFGSFSFKGISLGSTAGTLLVGVVISMSASGLYGIVYSIPSILSSFMLLLFMYALGLKVGPQFFPDFEKTGSQSFASEQSFLYSTGSFVSLVPSCLIWHRDMRPG